MTRIDFLNLLKTGAEIRSSGTTGKPKTIYRSPENLHNCVEVAAKVQEIHKTSSVLTVTSLNHAGGLLAQSLPAVYVGARVDVMPFQPFSFLSEFRHYTHTFLPPAHMKALMKVKSFENFNFEGRRILTGSDPVSWEVIEAFVQRNAIVQPNWGMSEVGPIVINSEFKGLEDLYELKKKVPYGETLLGNQFQIDWKVEDGELCVRGPLSIYEDWFRTGDLVSVNGEVMSYRGRRNVSLL